jgi:hypothetical protein
MELLKLARQYEGNEPHHKWGYFTAGGDGAECISSYTNADIVDLADNYDLICAFCWDEHHRHEITSFEDAEQCAEYEQSSPFRWVKESSESVVMETLCDVTGKGHEYPEKVHVKCGALVCYSCGHHDRIARCFCGWAIDGGNGRRQLEEMGETIDEPGYEYDYEYGDY